MSGKEGVFTNIAAYCRVSTETENQLNSLETQKAFFVEYARKNGHHLVRLYADEGLSGTKIKRRKEFQQMMADAEQGSFEMIVVKDISRLARNTVDLLQSIRRLKALGIETVFLTANMTSMGDSEFILTVFGAMAQEESANTSKRIKFGKRMNAQRGRVPNLVYGYDKTPGDYFHLSVNDREADVVRQIYTWYTAGGCGAGKIAAMLNQRGLRTKRGYAWSQNAVRRILTNPLYTGKIINGKQEVSDFLTSNRAEIDEADWLVADRPELRIIDEDRFRQAGSLLAARNQSFRLDRKRHSNQYLFSTLIQCKDCGRSFRRTSRTYRNTYVRWVCSRHNGQGTGSCPNAVGVEENLLISQLDAYFKTILPDSRRVTQLLRQELRRTFQNRDAAPKKQGLQLRLSRLERQRQQYIELFAEDLITRQELSRKLSDGKTEIAALEEELRQFQLSALDDEAADRIIRQVFPDFSGFVSVRNLSNTQLKQLVSGIEVSGDGTVDIYLCPSAEPSAP